MCLQRLILTPYRNICKYYVEGMAKRFDQSYHEVIQ